VNDKRLVKYVDDAMYKAEDIDAKAGPKVYLVNMTHDPLGSVACFSAMYEGKVKRHLGEVSDEERAYYLQQMLQTKLKAPLETIHFHFLIEGVTRAFTHQMVRQRTAVYAQESMRFAVKDTMPVGLPPSIAHVQLPMIDVPGEGSQQVVWSDVPGFDHLTEAEKMRVLWEESVQDVQDIYNRLIGLGMPAEDARGLAPTNVLTRINYDTNLRNLLDHAGNRLCTQAQFEWRLVFAGIVEAIREHWRNDIRFQRYERAYEDKLWDSKTYLRHCGDLAAEYAAIASLLKPICYQVGHCTFKADFDRKCSIRNRVEANAALNRPSSEWDQELDNVEGNPIVVGVGPRSVMTDGDPAKPVFIGAIKPQEWLLDPAAAR
jgi:flavin-dependent thymidylate synthase